MASDAVLDWPILRLNTGASRMPSTTSATPAATQRRRTISRAQRLQAREAVSSLRIRGQSTRGPTFDSSAGSRVRVTSTLTSGMSMPPMPMLRSSGTGTTTSAIRLIATVTPEARTACPAVATAVTTASSLLAPWARSSRQRETSSSE